MSARVVTLLIALGVLVALMAGLSNGFDVVTVVVFGAIVFFGALAIVIARRSESGRIVPGSCMECGGVISPNAPYCKHCGARRA